MDVFAGFHGRVLTASSSSSMTASFRTRRASRASRSSRRGTPSHGDLATNAAMVLAKPSGLAPRALAERIVPLLASDPHIESVEIAGPGFINLTLAGNFWPRVLRMVLEQGDGYGMSAIGKGNVVNVEYVSANPTGPMHVGQCRGAVFGDALANLLVFAGFDCHRESDVNDAGAGDAMARSAYLRYREALGGTRRIPEGLYTATTEAGRRLAVEQHGSELLGLPESEWLPIVRDAALTAMLAMIEKDLGELASATTCSSLSAP